MKNTQNGSSPSRKWIIVVLPDTTIERTSDGAIPVFWRSFSKSSVNVSIVHARMSCSTSGLSLQAKISRTEYRFHRQSGGCIRSPRQAQYRRCSLPGAQRRSYFQDQRHSRNALLLYRPLPDQPPARCFHSMRGKPLCYSLPHRRWDTVSAALER